MKILILNRRDIGNPFSGGAEIYTHEIARGLVERHACDMTVFSCSFSGSLPEEVIDQVRYVRGGNEVTVHARGFYYALKNRSHFDLIIDEFNGIGFFTFAFPNAVLLIHQLYKEFWLRELGFLGWLPYLIEPQLLRLYRKRKTITISPSTKSDLEELGFCRIDVVKVAVNLRPSHDLRGKDETPILVFLGRLKSTKRPEDAIRIYERVRRQVPESRLWLIGRGPAEERLRDMARDVEGVTFWGWVSEEEKAALLRRASVLLVPGVREGFGINIVEAAAAATPAVGYSVQGVKDAILDSKTGYLVNSVEEAAEKTLGLLRDKALYAKMCSACIRYAGEFTWSTRVDEFWSAIGGKQEVHRTKM
jgi:glycosyltransferase involved in cell wall biosynthesis